MISMPIGSMCGLFKLEAFKADKNGVEIEGTRRLLADWFPNLITNNGLDLFGSSDAYLQYCQVGSGSTTPANGNTALVNRIAGSSTPVSSTTGAQSSAPYFAYRRKTFRFDEGVAAGNIAEVGVGASSTANLFSRALILDSGGSPTTITVLSDESLDAAYELRVYPATSDWTDTVTIGGVDYTVTGRASSVTSWEIGSNGSSNIVPGATAYNGSIGAITGVPSGSSGATTSVSMASYSNGSYHRDATITFDLDRGNLAGGITAMSCTFGASQLQFGFSPAIPKTSSNILTLTVRNAWARKTL